MMNRLTQKAPSAVMIDGAFYPVNTDFRACILTAMAIEDPKLADWEKAEILIENLYSEPYPENIQKAVELGFKFLSCGETTRNSRNEKLCDLQQDSRFIYAALLKAGVDLSKPMHWWDFMAHFSEIPESTFSRIVYLRMQHNKGKLTKEERAECDRMGWDIINFTSDAKEKETLDKYFFGE